MTSFLELTSLISAASALIMIIILSVEWNTIFLFAILLNFSYRYYSSLFTPLDIDSKETFLAMPMLTLLQHASLMPNVNLSTSTLFHLINNTSHLINIAISLTCYLNTKQYSMVPLQFILTKRFTLISNLEVNCCITALTLFLTSTDKLSKRNLIK